MSTSTLATLLDRLSQRIGDYLDVVVTTALTTSTNVVSTNLLPYTNRDKYYSRYWLYVEDYVNAGQYRKINDYTAATGTCAVLGANFTSDGSNMATVQVHKYDRANKIRAINLAARKTWPTLFRLVRNEDLISNNALPNGRFTDWTSSSYPDYWRVSSTPTATASEVTTAGLIRGGTASALVTATNALAYMGISSDQYPPLLDLMGRTVSFKCWAYPSVANDATLVIYTLKADGTTQTLTSTTTCPASKWTLLELEDQGISDDIQYIQFRLKLTTAATTCYFANARVIDTVSQYVLPLDFQNPIAEVNRVFIQSSSRADDACDDLSPSFTPLYGWDTADDATTKYLVAPILPSERIIRLEGIAPLESNLSSTTDTITIEDPYLDLLIEYAAYQLFDMEAGLPSSQDRDNLLRESLRYLASYNTLRRGLKMIMPSSTQRIDRRLL